MKILLVLLLLHSHWFKSTVIGYYLPPVSTTPPSTPPLGTEVVDSTSPGGVGGTGGTFPPSSGFTGTGGPTTAPTATGTFPTLCTAPTVNNGAFSVQAGATLGSSEIISLTCNEGYRPTKKAFTCTDRTPPRCVREVNSELCHCQTKVGRCLGGLKTVVKKCQSYMVKCYSWTTQQKCTVSSGWNPNWNGNPGWNGNQWGNGQYNWGKK